VQGDDRSAWSADFLLEKKIGNGGAFTIEAEWADYSGLGGYNGDYVEDKGGYVLGAYVFPMMENGHKLQILGKFGVANFSEGLTLLDPDYDQKTNEINFYYLFKEFDGRVMVFYKDTRFDGVRTNNKQSASDCRFRNRPTFRSGQADGEFASGRIGESRGTI
jgi:hypothetical protein